jgi:hypothetical protein
MSDQQWPGPRNPDLPPIGMIDVTGTLEHQRDAATSVAVKAFRDWLVSRYSGAKIVVRTEHRASELGRAHVQVVPAKPLVKEPGGLGTADQAVLLYREGDIIGQVWRKMVSWGH